MIKDKDVVESTVGNEENLDDYTCGLSLSDYQVFSSTHWGCPEHVPSKNIVNAIRYEHDNMFREAREFHNIYRNSKDLMKVMDLYSIGRLGSGHRCDEMSYMSILVHNVSEIVNNLVGMAWCPPTFAKPNIIKVFVDLSKVLATKVRGDAIFMIFDPSFPKVYVTTSLILDAAIHKTKITILRNKLSNQHLLSDKVKDKLTKLENKYASKEAFISILSVYDGR